MGRRGSLTKTDNFGHVCVGFPEPRLILDHHQAARLAGTEMQGRSKPGYNREVIKRKAIHGDRDGHRISQWRDGQSHH
jgi:hypothetical protein